MPIHSSLSLVIDSNIWIYLYYSGLLDAAFRLGSLHDPDLMLTKEPLTELSWQDLQDKGVILDELPSDSMRIVMQIAGDRRNVSVCDVACLVLSEQLHVPLVTNDKKLRKLAVHRHALLHDFDALLDLMVAADIINGEARKVAFETLAMVHERL